MQNCYHMPETSILKTILSIIFESILWKQKTMVKRTISKVLYFLSDKSIYHLFNRYEGKKMNLSIVNEKQFCFSVKIKIMNHIIKHVVTTSIPMLLTIVNTSKLICTISCKLTIPFSILYGGWNPDFSETKTKIDLINNKLI